MLIVVRPLTSLTLNMITGIKVSCQSRTCSMYNLGGLWGENSSTSFLYLHKQQFLFCPGGSRSRDFSH